MKKTVCALLCAVLSAAVVLAAAGCSDDDHSGSGLNPKYPITLTVWHYYNGAQLQEFDDLVDEFNETVGEQKGIIIESVSQGSVNGLISALLDASDADDGSFPDIYATYADTAYMLDKAGRVADLSGYLTAAEKNSYVSAYFDEGAFNSKDEIKIFPTAKSTESLFLNYTAWQNFAAATGASEDSLKTWEGLTEVAQNYYNWTDSLTPDVEGDGKAFFGRDAVENYILIGSMQLGFEIFEVLNGNVTFNIDENAFRKLWQNYYVPYINGYFTNKGRFSSDDMKTGDIVAFIGSTTSVTYMPTEVYEEGKAPYLMDAKILPLPNFAGTRPYAVQQGAGMAVNKMTRTRELAAATFLKWFTESSRSLAFSVNSGYLPVKDDVNNTAAIDEAFKNYDFDNIDSITDKDQKIETIKKLRTRDALKVGIETAQTYTLYTNKAFTDGTQARQIIQNSISSYAKTDAAAIAARISAGEEKNIVLEQYLSEEYFQAFLTDLRSRLNVLQTH